jgi:uncharacterized repeat protein (TIGR01451 family)
MLKKFLSVVAFTLCFHTGYSQCSAVVTTQSTGCDTLCNGLAVFQFSGGAMPYELTYIYNGGVPVGPFTVTTVYTMGNLCPGTYSFIVIDANGDTCAGNSPFTINSTISPQPHASAVNASCSGCNDGAATLDSVSNGVPPFTYQWSNGAISSFITGLTPGVYTVTVTDANGCIGSDTVNVGVGQSGYYTLNGRVYYDVNGNGIQDAGEYGLSNHSIILSPGAFTSYSWNLGDYGFVVAPGTYTVNYNTSGWHVASGPTSYNPTVTTTSVSNLNFGVQPDSAWTSITVSVTSGLPRCLWSIPYYLTVQNTGTMPVSGTASFEYDSDLTFQSSSVPPLSVAGNLITYSISNLYPGSSIQFVIYFLEPVAGTAILNTINAVAIDSLGNVLDSTGVYQTQTVTCSYDPNDKAVNPEGYGMSHFVTMQTDLDYIIRFQNTGTDTAFTVVIIDTLDADIDLNTFTITGSSHPMITNVDNVNHIVTFTFENILLPDSNVNEPLSHGYVQYRVNGLSSLPDPTIINNTAYIYFDQNSPVQTNTTLTTLSDNFLSVEEPSAGNWILYPNPMEEFAILNFTGDVNFNFSAIIFDITGRKVSGPVYALDKTIFIKKDHLKSGTYIIEMISSDPGYKPEYLKLMVK